MRRGKSVMLVEAMAVLAARAGGELDPLAPAPARDLDRLGDHRLAEPAIPPFARDPDRLDQHALGPDIVEARDEGKLQRADDLAVHFGDVEGIRRRSRNGVERRVILLRQRLLDAVALLPERVVGEHAHDPRQVLALGFPQQHGGAHAWAKNASSAAAVARGFSSARKCPESIALPSTFSAHSRQTFSGAAVSLGMPAEPHSASSGHALLLPAARSRSPAARSLVCPAR